MVNNKIIYITLIFILFFVPSVVSEVTTITSSNQNPDQKVSTELLISSTIKKEFASVYQTIQTDMMDEIHNVQSYADNKIEEAYAKLTLFYLKVIISLCLINLISIILAQFIIFRLRAKELDYLRMFTIQNNVKTDKTNNNYQRNNNNSKIELDKQINEISDDLKKLNNTIPKPDYVKSKHDDVISIDNL